MDLASSPVFLDAGSVKGSALVVFLTKSKVPMTLADIKRNHGQRDWDAKFPELERNIAPDQVEGVVRKLQHGYRGEKEVHDAVVRLLDSLQLPSHNLVSYYEHCRSMQRDLGVLAEEDLDYQDLFCDKRREKIFSEEFGFPCTFAAVSDLLRLHPSLMEESWYPTNAPRDADSLWREAAADVERFEEMLRTDSSLKEEERLRLMPRALVQDRRLYVNYTANFLLIGHCRGPLAQNLRIKGAALKALAEVGVSSAVRAVLSRVLQEDASGLRGQLDPAADAGSSLMQALQTQSQALQAVQTALGKQHEAIVVLQQNIGNFHEKTVSLQELLGTLQTWVKNELAQLLAQAVCFSLSQKFKDLREEIRTSLSNPSSSFIEAIRKAVKLPAMRRTADGDRFPEEQRVTPDEERFVESLSVLLTQELERLVAQSAVFGHARLPGLTYGAWKRCRSLIGSRCLALRKLTGDASKPLLWTTSAGAGGRFNGGGQHYVYLKESRTHIGGDVKVYLRKVLKQKLKRSRNSSTVEEHIRRLIATTAPENWPLSSSNVDAFAHDASEEQMGRDMAD
jgi:hypothetical protein